MADGTSFSSPSPLSASLTPAPSPAEPGETLPLVAGLGRCGRGEVRGSAMSRLASLSWWWR